MQTARHQINMDSSRTNIIVQSRVARSHYMRQEWTPLPVGQLCISLSSIFTGEYQSTVYSYTTAASFNILTYSLFTLNYLYVYADTSGYGAVLQIGISLVRFQMVSLEFFIDIKSFRSHYGPWSRLSL